MSEEPPVDVGDTQWPEANDLLRLLVAFVNRNTLCRREELAHARCEQLFLPCFKYERQEGRVTLEECADMFRSYPITPSALETTELLRLMSPSQQPRTFFGTKYIQGSNSHRRLSKGTNWCTWSWIIHWVEAAHCKSLLCDGDEH